MSDTLCDLVHMENAIIIFGSNLLHGQMTGKNVIFGLEKKKNY